MNSTHVDPLQLEAEVARQEQDLLRKRALLAHVKSNASPVSASFIHAQNSLQPSFSPAAPVEYDGSIHHNGAPLGHAVSRSQPSQQSPMKRTKTSHPRPQHLISESAAGMTRSKSSFAVSSSCPFTGGSGPIKQLQPQTPSSMDRYLYDTEQQQPANNYVLAHTMETAALRSKSDLEAVMEAGGIMQNGVVMENPDAWLQRTVGVDDIPRDYNGNSLAMSINGQHFGSPAILPMYQHDLPQSQCGSLTSAPTIETAMTRSNSTANQSVSGHFQMMRLGSQSSVSEMLPGPEYGANFTMPAQYMSIGSKRSAPSDEQLLGINSPMLTVPSAGMHSENMSRSISVDSRMSSNGAQQSPPTSDAVDRLAIMHGIQMKRTKTSESQMSDQSFLESSNNFPTEESEPMLRSISASSSKSTQSQPQRDRAKDSLQRQIAAGTQQALAPKPKADPSKTEAVPQSNAKVGKDGKAAVPKNTYKRPKHPKVTCKFCNDYPEGFRGDHELRRHVDAKHGVLVKKWVCVDPVLKGLRTEYKPVKRIDECKHCNSGKMYGAYYNAAAHLRRYHFQEKAPRASRAKNGQGGDGNVAGKRGGKGGGDWPPINELKRWMEERKVNQSENCAPDNTTMQDEDEVQNFDQDIYDADINAFTNPAAGQFDAITTYGVGSNLKVENADVYNGTLNDMYGTSPTQFDTSMVIPSTGSANFNFNSPLTGNMNYQGLPMDYNPYHSPNVSTSSATLTAFNNGFMQEPQFMPGVSQVSNAPLGQSPHDGLLGDFNFDMAIAGDTHDVC